MILRLFVALSLYFLLISQANGKPSVRDDHNQNGKGLSKADKDGQSHMSNDGVGNAADGRDSERQTSHRKHKRIGRRWHSLAHSEECENDIATLCPKSVRLDNFAVLDCLEHDDATVEKISERCQHFIWQFKRNMTTSPVFEAASRHVCDRDFKNITQCDGVPEGGQKIACLFEYKHNIQSPECLMFMNKVGAILFSDYHLIYQFTKYCNYDISRLACGRSVGRASLEGQDSQKKDVPSSQGRTIECLLDDVDKLKAQCTHQIMRVAELQADDYHLDRPLYFACRNDRENLCGKVTAGQGRVMKCLMKASQDPTMSTNCRELITKRMQLREKDYKVDYSFAGSCAKDLQTLHCLSEKTIRMLQKDGKMGASVALSAVILCLENAVKAHKQVAPECLSEMFDIRKQMMADYKITPEIVAYCARPIKSHCHNGIERNGATLHCLMDLYKGTMETKGVLQEKYPECKRALERLITVADPGSDYRIDPVIGRTCGSVISASCQDQVKAAPHAGAVISCLMNHMDAPEMTDSCAEKLLELQYILSRDFRLNPSLYENCKEDAEKVCQAPKDWATASSNFGSRTSGNLVLSCLFRNMQEKEYSDEKDEDDDDDKDDHGSNTDKSLISKRCMQEVVQVFRERAGRIMLNPLVYEKCLSDLSQNCMNLRKGRTEMQCLQENYENLRSNDCQEIVRRFAIEQERHPTLDYILAASCRPMIKLFCKAEMTSDSGRIMPCLIQHKKDVEMDKKCAAGVEHHQIISLKDFRISRAFRRSCSRDLSRLCKEVRTKTEAITCLSEHIRNATLLDKKIEMSKACRKQVRFENFQKSEDIRLSPRLAKACAVDIKRHCNDDKDTQVQCLRQHWSSLTTRCQRVLFRRVQLESMDSRIDARLQRVCKPMIKHFCSGREKHSLDCLWEHIHDEYFDQKCRKVVYLRLETRVRDYRLDPLIMHLCKHDIRKHCKSVLDPRNNMTGSEYRGKVSNCLKKQYNNFVLSSGCHGHIRQLIVETNMNFHMDPILRRACEKDVQRLCATELEETDGADGEGRVTECLKKSLTKNAIKEHDCRTEMIRLLQEGHADVHVDPLLYQACQHELNTICQNVPLGNGKQMACLLWAKDDKEARKGMSHVCRKQVQSRAEMWEFAAKLAPPESISELASQITTSSAKNYFFAFLATVILAIFVFGLCCGRVTKRVRVDAKNK